MDENVAPVVNKLRWYCSVKGCDNVSQVRRVDLKTRHFVACHPNLDFKVRTLIS